MFYLKHIIVLFGLFSQSEGFNNAMNRRNFITKSLTANALNPFLYTMNEGNNNKEDNYKKDNDKSRNYKNNIYFTGGLNEENCFNLKILVVDDGLQYI